MSRQLVESIIDKDFVLAESHFNDRLSSIMEKKLYERKRQAAADMNEVFGGLSLAQIQARKELGWPRASEVYGDPRDKTISSTTAKKKTKTTTKKPAKAKSVSGVSSKTKTGGIKKAKVKSVNVKLKEEEMGGYEQQRELDRLKQKKFRQDVEAEKARLGDKAKPQEPKKDKFGDTRPRILGAKLKPTSQETPQRERPLASGLAKNVAKAVKLRMSGSKTAMPRLGKITKAYAGRGLSSLPGTALKVALAGLSQAGE